MSEGLRLQWLSSFGDADEALIVAGEDNPFDSDGTIRFREKDDHVALVDADHRPVAVVGLTDARARVGDTVFDVVGVGGVIVAAEQRGRGLARELLSAALGRAEESGRPFAMLFCWPSRAGLYERLGFTAISDVVTVDQPGARTATMNMETMWRALAPGRTWPPGPVALEGLPF